MKILITGQNGQVARCLAELSHPGCGITFARRPDFDLAQPTSVEKTISSISPDVIISAAAYTAVDQAEDEPELAFKINCMGPATLAHAAAKVGSRIIHLSTDYVFSGDSDRPYTEDDQVEPLGVYGKSKLLGEEAIAASSVQHVILRTAWVYSVHGANFVKTMLRLAGVRDRVQVVSDQYGSPTSAHELARAIYKVITCWQGSNSSASGTYHFAGSGETNWSGLAEFILEESRKVGGPSATVDPILSSDWPTRATRPKNSRLSSAKFSRSFGYTAPDWKVSVGEVVSRLVSSPAQRNY